MKRTHVAVLRGGPSTEFEVSMKTGAAVLDALTDSEFVLHDIIISKQGEWLAGGFAREPQHALAATDVVFNALHGSYGEDGGVQRTLDRLGIPYTGSRAYASAIAMNKHLTKEQLKKHGIKSAPHFRVQRDSYSDPIRTSSTIGQLFGPSYIIKPLRGGSSIGVEIARDTRELAEILQRLSEDFDDVLVEQFIDGREATVGVLENYRGCHLYDLPAIEIVRPDTTSFFTYTDKYSGQTEELCPGRFSHDEKQELRDVALRAHELLGLRHYSRTDLMVAQDGIYFLEVNTLPGLTAASLLPQAVASVGGSYRDLIVHLLDLAVHQNSSQEHLSSRSPSVLYS